MATWIDGVSEPVLGMISDGEAQKRWRVTGSTGDSVVVIAAKEQDAVYFAVRSGYLAPEDLDDTDEVTAYIEDEQGGVH
ncbi:Uncharacterised protein [Mycobacteroides abscessus subsp. abscessus]|uniref:hypothetical protein n=1 Tax=Mycobacteroides abscessus TaxID=36809 RepID=UPI0009294AAB|nr:hypothetical protein [Mycobacteroides abscessus]SIH33813.1 Uncharacterised protein [Mycobacteroides abscessus subsp. abscessus]